MLAALALCLLAPQDWDRPQLVLNRGTPTGIESAVFSPDGRTLATVPVMPNGLVATQPAVVLWDVSRQEEKFSLSMPQMGGAFAFSPTGLPMIGGMGLVEVHPELPDVALFWLEGNPDVLALGMNAADETLCVFSDGVVARFATMEGSGPEPAEPVGQFRLPAEPVGARLTADARTLVAWWIDRPPAVYDLQTERLLGTLPLEPQRLQTLQIAAGGKTIVARTATQVHAWQGPWNAPSELRPIALDSGPRANEPPPFAFGSFDQLVAVSPDGRLAAIDFGAQRCEIWDLVEHRRTHTFDDLVLTFSPSSTSVLVRSGIEAELIRLEDEQRLATFRGYVSPVTGVSTSRSGRRVVATHADGRVDVWDTAEGVVSRTLEAGTGVKGTAFLFGEDERRVALLRRTGALADPPFGAPPAGDPGPGAPSAGAPSAGVPSAGVPPGGDPGTPDGPGRTAPPPTGLPPEPGAVADPGAAGPGEPGSTPPSLGMDAVEDDRIEVWDQLTGERVASQSGTAVAPLPDGRLVLGNAERNVFLWDPSSDQRTPLFRGPEPAEPMPPPLHAVRGLAVSADGKRIAALIAQRILLWDREASKLVLELPGAFTSVGLDAAGKRIAAGSVIGTVSVYDAATGNVVLESDGLLPAAMAPDGKTLLGHGLAWGVLAIQRRTEEPIESYFGTASSLQSIAFSPDGRTAWAGYEDGTLAAVSVTGRKVLAHAVGFTDGTWAVLDEHGRFDATNGGAVDGMSCLIHDERIGLEQIKDAYYDPHLLAKALGKSAAPLRQVVDLTGDSLELHPAMEVLQAPTAETRRVEVQLVDRGGGIGPVQVFVNGREFLADARPSDFDPEAAELRLTADLSACPYFDPNSDNIVRVVPSNRSGDLKGRGGRVRVRRSRSRQRVEQTFRALVVGVSDYNGKQIDLDFAAHDAEVFGGAVELAAKNLFDKVEVQSLYDGASVAPTRKNVLAALDSMADAKASDTLLVYLAGHGVAHKGEYYYLLNEATSLEINNAALADQFALSGADLTAWTKKLAAQRVVLILDTCSSGQVIDSLTGARGDDSSRLRALERMKDRGGMFILAGSAADGPSYESSPFGHGLLTYTLLDAMRGASLRDKRFVDVQRMFNHARDRVPQLAEGLKGIQRPRIAVPTQGAFDTFDIGVLDATHREKIQLAGARPTVTLSRFEQRIRTDPLRLTETVGNALAEHSASVRTAKFVYASDNTVSGAFLLSGEYRIEAGRIKGSVFVIKDEQLVDQFEVDEAEAEPRKLADAVVRGLVGVLGKQE